VSFDQADANLVTAYKTLGQIESYAGDPGNPRAFNGAGNIGDGVYIGKRIANSSKDYINNIDEMKNTSSMLMQVRDDNIIDYSQKTDHPPRWWY
jgi:hypothetical protein